MLEQYLAIVKPNLQHTLEANVVFAGIVVGALVGGEAGLISYELTHKSTSAGRRMAVERGMVVGGAAGAAVALLGLHYLRVF